METIKQYLESMFKGLPKTDELQRIKDDLLFNMDEKYEELKKEGKSENEAIGIVISEFGNIDELLQEMDIHVSSDETNNTNEENTPLLSQDEVQTYLSFTKIFGEKIALGVLLILVGVSGLILVSTFTSNTKYEALAIIPLFLALIPAVALFIYYGMKNEEYEFIEKGNFRISTSTKAYLESQIKTKHDLQIKTIIFSVCLFIISPLIVIITHFINESFILLATSIMIFIISIGVYSIIRVCVPIDSYKKLLKIGDYTAKNQQAERIIGAVASVVWPLATAVFLYMGFVYNAWGRAWIIFPVLGVVFGAFSAGVNAWYTDSSQKH